MTSYFSAPRNRSLRRFISFLVASALISVLLVSSLNGFATTGNSPGFPKVAAASVFLSPNLNNNITVVSSALNGSKLTGFSVELRVNGTDVKSGTTPVTFSNLTTGVQYVVVANSCCNSYFRHYSNGNLNRFAVVNLTGSSPVSLDAVYQNVTAPKAATLNILAQFSNGTQIGTSDYTPGMWLTVVPPNQTNPFTGAYTGGSILPFTLFKNENYTIQITQGYGNIQFSHWKDNNSPNATRVIQLSSNSTYTAIYQATNVATSTNSTSSTSSTSTTTTSTSTSTQSSSSSTLRTSSTTTSATSSTSSTTTSNGSSPFGNDAILALAIIVVAIIVAASAIAIHRRHKTP